MNHEQVKKALTLARTELEARIERTHKHIFHKDAPVSANFHEQVVETGNDPLVHALEEEANYELRQINRALQRLENGDYEECSRCGEEIGDARLEAVPYTELCIECAETETD